MIHNAFVFFIELMKKTKNDFEVLLKGNEMEYNNKEVALTRSSKANSGFSQDKTVKGLGEGKSICTYDEGYESNEEGGDLEADGGESGAVEDDGRDTAGIAVERVILKDVDDEGIDNGGESESNNSGNVVNNASYNAPGNYDDSEGNSDGNSDGDIESEGVESEGVDGGDENENVVNDVVGSKIVGNENTVDKRENTETQENNIEQQKKPEKYNLMNSFRKLLPTRLFENDRSGKVERKVLTNDLNETLANKSGIVKLTEDVSNNDKSVNTNIIFKQRSHGKEKFTGSTDSNIGDIVGYTSLDDSSDSFHSCFSSFTDENNNHVNVGDNKHSKTTNHFMSTDKHKDESASNIRYGPNTKTEEKSVNKNSDYKNAYDIYMDEYNRSDTRKCSGSTNSNGVKYNKVIGNSDGGVLNINRRNPTRKHSDSSDSNDNSNGNNLYEYKNHDPPKNRNTIPKITKDNKINHPGGTDLLDSPKAKGKVDYAPTPKDNQITHKDNEDVINCNIKKGQSNQSDGNHHEHINKQTYKRNNDNRMSTGKYRAEKDLNYKEKGTSHNAENMSNGSKNHLPVPETSNQKDIGQLGNYIPKNLYYKETHTKPKDKVRYKASKILPALLDKVIFPTVPTHDPNLEGTKTDINDTKQFSKIGKTDASLNLFNIPSSDSAKQDKNQCKPDVKRESRLYKIGKHGNNESKKAKKHKEPIDKEKRSRKIPLESVKGNNLIRRLKKTFGKKANKYRMKIDKNQRTCKKQGVQARNDKIRRELKNKLAKRKLNKVARVGILGKKRFKKSRLNKHIPFPLLPKKQPSKSDTIKIRSKRFKECKPKSSLKKKTQMQKDKINPALKAKPRKNAKITFKSFFGYNKKNTNGKKKSITFKTNKIRKNRNGKPKTRFYGGSKRKPSTLRKLAIKKINTAKKTRYFKPKSKATSASKTKPSIFRKLPTFRTNTAKKTRYFKPKTNSTSASKTKPSILRRLSTPKTNKARRTSNTKPKTRYYSAASTKPSILSKLSTLWINKARRTSNTKSRTGFCNASKTKPSIFRKLPTFRINTAKKTRYLKPKTNSTSASKTKPSILRKLPTFRINTAKKTRHFKPKTKSTSASKTKPSIFRKLPTFRINNAKKTRYFKPKTKSTSASKTKPSIFRKLPTFRINTAKKTLYLKPKTKATSASKTKPAFTKKLPTFKINTAKKTRYLKPKTKFTSGPKTKSSFLKKSIASKSKSKIRGLLNKQQAKCKQPRVLKPAFKINKIPSKINKKQNPIKKIKNAKKIAMRT